MQRNFILDEEINLVENDDFLNTKVYADNLKSVIKNAPLKKSFTIGLFGEWGSGKSSIIKTVQDDLERTKKKKIKFIIYDAWKYSNDSFRRMFLLCMQKGLKHTETGLMNSFYLNENEDVKIKKSFNLKNVLIIIGILILGLILINIVPKSENTENWKFSLSIVISFIGLLTTILLKVFDELKINIQKPRLFAPEQFEDCFKEMVEKSVKHYTCIEKTQCYVKGQNFLKDIDRLIIVIDNIDRCHKEMAYELLTNIKNFLGNPYNIIFIIPIDDSALRKHIISSSKNNENGTCDKEAEEFLRKFFNVTIRIKHYHSEEMFDFAEKINQKYSLIFLPDTISVVSKEYARNPRRIIQLFNNLSVELCSFPDDFAKQYESVICKLLIIREEFPDFYYKVSLNSYLLHHATDETLTTYSDRYPGLRGFLNNTRVVTQDISSEVLEKILSNSNVFSGISQDLLSSINNIDIENIDKSINEGKVLKETVIKYIVEQLKKGVARGTFDSEVIPKFNLITALNEKYPLEKSQNIIIQEIIQNASILKNIFDKNDIITAIGYCNVTYHQGISYLTNYLINRVNNEITKPELDLPNFGEVDKRWYDALKNLVKTYKDASVLKGIKDAFISYYFIDNSILDFDNLSDEQIKSLVTGACLTKMINNIKVLTDDDIYYNDFSNLTKIIDISDNIVNHFIARINLIYPNFNFKTIQDIDSIIQIINNCFELLKNDLSKNSTELNNLFSKVISNRKSSQSSPQSVNFINQSINIPQIVENIIIFCCHIYRLTFNNVNITSVLNQLIANPENRTTINSQLVELMKIFSLYPLFEIIMSDSTCTTDSFKLLKNAFIKKRDEKYLVSNENLSGKLKEILTMLYNDDPRSKDLFIFLEELISDIRIKDTLIKLISIQSKENILKLSPKLQSLAIDTVLESDNIFNYQDNVEFLKVVANNGEPKHILKLVNLLMTKLPNEAQLQDAVSILMEIKRLNSRDASRLKTELENYQSNESYQEIISQALAHVKETREDKNDSI